MLKETLVGFNVDVRTRVAMDAERLMAPLNWPSPVTVIMEEAEEPEPTLMRVGAETVKSTTLTVTVTVWDRVPLVPFTVRRNVPRLEELTVRVEEAVVPSVTLAGLRENVRPRGVADDTRDTVPVKPPRLSSRTVSVLDEPSSIEEIVGPEILKSTTPTLTVTEWVSEPLVPVTVTM